MVPKKRSSTTNVGLQVLQLLCLEYCHYSYWLVMFLLSTALWLGRIGVEFLDPNVKILGVYGVELYCS